jgi:hypothetical protein
MNGWMIFILVALVWLGGFTFGRHAGKEEE